MRYNTSYPSAIDELDYIKSINPVNPGDTFNNDPQCFAEYCNMQANHYSEWHLIAEEMRQSRDIAQPDYRTIARNNGRNISGTIVEH